MRRKCTGAKPYTEVLELRILELSEVHSQVERSETCKSPKGIKRTERVVRYATGRGATNTGRSRIVRDCGLYWRENAGMSSESKVRIFAVESLRFPEEGLSSQGKSGPKPRTTVVGDGQQVDIPAPRKSV